MNSIRTRLLVLLIGGILSVVLVSYALLYILVSRSLTREFDSNLKSRVESMSHMAEWWDGDITDDEVYEDGGDDPENLVRFEFSELDLPEFEESDNADYYQVWDEADKVYARSPSLDGENLLHDFESARGRKITRALLPDERSGRVAWIEFVPPVQPDSIENRPNTRFHLALARPTEGLAETFAVLRTSLLISAALAAAITALLIWYVVNRGLRPLVDIGNELRATHQSDLSHRIDAAAKPVELVPICTRLNEMLARLESAFDRERRFNADVAHELRTPLAELRTLAEVSGRRDALSDADRGSYRDVAEIAVRMERLVSALLDLSRHSSGEISTDMQRVNVAALIDQAWKPFSAASAAKGHELRFAAEHTLEAQSDPLILATILSNLFSNAVEYTPHGGRISVECISKNGAVSLVLSNTTNTLVAGDLPRLFEKFWRKDPLRNADNHLGLGLSLVEALARVLGIQIECAMPEPGKLRTILILPA